MELYDIQYGAFGIIVLIIIFGLYLYLDISTRGEAEKEMKENIKSKKL